MTEGGLCQDGSIEKLLCVGYILKVEMTEFSKGFAYAPECETKREDKNNSKAFGLSNC